jgi:hypothetical protein
LSSSEEDSLSQKPARLKTTVSVAVVEGFSAVRTVDKTSSEKLPFCFLVPFLVERLKSCHRGDPPPAFPWNEVLKTKYIYAVLMSQIAGNAKNNIRGLHARI